MHTPETHPDWFPKLRCRKCGKEKPCCQYDGGPCCLDCRQAALTSNAQQEVVKSVEETGDDLDEIFGLA